MHTVYHAHYNGVPGYAKQAEREDTWLFVPEGTTLLLECPREALTLLGDTAMAATQRQRDGNLAAKVCGY